MPQPLAVNTMDSAPASMCGQSASMAFRICVSASSEAAMCRLMAPQQASGEGISSMPKRSSTRAAAALMSGASPGCTQPCQMSILRLCVFPGQGPATRRRGMRTRRFRGSRDRRACPVRSSAVNRRLCGTSARTVRRAILWPIGLGASRSASSRPTSSSRP